MDRKDLLLEEREEKHLSKERTERILTEGGALVNMMDTYGWKLLYEGFLLPNIEEARFLGAPREDLADIRAEMRVLRQMLKYIDTRVKDANKVAEKIKK